MLIMSETSPRLSAAQIAARHGKERWRLLDIARDVHAALGCLDAEAIDAIAAHLDLPRVEVEGLTTFYAFFRAAPAGRITIRLCDDVVDRMAGYQQVKAAFERELGVAMGQTTPDGRFTLEHAPCIGMCDQAPAALINDVVVTRLTDQRVRAIVHALRKHDDPTLLNDRVGDGNNAHPLVRSMVENNIRLRGPIIFGASDRHSSLAKALALPPEEIIRTIKNAKLRGRGGAGFPTGVKWEVTRAAPGVDKCVICNADEGEPGTFKDRVLLTELPDLVIAGLTIAGYAIGAREGILYLRAEYAYLRAFLEDILRQRRQDGLLGRSILGHADFDFDIRIQMGAGAYICGEETALISSCEGRRGEPKTRPPFPAQKGYFDRPTSVTNVETLACVTRILEDGAEAFLAYGTPKSSGTKLLSISGDCDLPGIYEVPIGTPLREVLRLCGAQNPAAVQIGGPTGAMVGPAGFDRRIDFEDLSTGGAIVVFGPTRNIPGIVSEYMGFFIHESCGYCTPCRVGTRLLKRKVDELIAGQGQPRDLDALLELCQTVKQTSRCGLGQMAPNPILSTLKNFPEVYAAMVKPEPHGFQPTFDLGLSVELAERIAGRRSTHAHQETRP